MFFPSQEEFLKLSSQGNLIPIYKEILGDLETPVSAYLKMAQDSKYSFLLESVEGEEKVARYSFLAQDPELIFQSKKRQATITKFKKRKPSIAHLKIVDSPFSFIREIMAQYKFVPVVGLPRFCGGLVGYISYDTVRFFEDLPQKTRDDLHLPDIILILAKEIIIFDHLSHKIKIVSCVEVPSESSDATKKKIYDQATKKIDDLIKKLKRPLVASESAPKTHQEILVKSNMSEPQFEDMVEKAKKDIKNGEIIQIVLSQRFEVKLPTTPLNIYRALRSINPSPYMYYLNFDAIHIIGSSPELLVRCEEGIVETRPIAGTRHRGKDEAEDETLAKELLKDPKEKAEHIMLVDLGRNDLGRVCKQGTVRVSEFMKIEKYSHVMHIVSNVRGDLRKDKDIFDVLQAAFPAGTLSGAPKIRAMEIIEDLETVTRGPYGGCIGYFSFSGNLDTCITIRTIVAKDSKAYLQAGAGIVADSNPKKEYYETINKAKAQIAAMEMAQQLS